MIVHYCYFQFCYHLGINMRAVFHSIIFHDCAVNCCKYPNLNYTFSFDSCKRRRSRWIWSLTMNLCGRSNLMKMLPNRMWMADSKNHACIPVFHVHSPFYIVHRAIAGGFVWFIEKYCHSKSVLFTMNTIDTTLLITFYIFVTMCIHTAFFSLCIYLTLHPVCRVWIKNYEFMRVSPNKLLVLWCQ